ncbi:MAG: hypothetical protein MJ152_00540, partial [Clostridia bacterium]|nr:hypothetical protein [Clostridia bacterium]
EGTFNDYIGPVDESGNSTAKVVITPRTANVIASVSGSYSKTYDGTTMDGNKYKGSYSGMEAAFTKEALDLMRNYKDTGIRMSDVDKVDANKMCVSSYGIHFVYYVGEISSTNDPDPNSAFCSKNVVGVDNLCSTLNPLTGETYFDKLFNSVYPTDSNEEIYASVDSYDVYEESLIDNSKITIDETKLNGTKSSI